MINLKDYETTIKKASAEHGLEAKDAADQFIQNLLVMKDQYPWFDSDINFRTLGQEWNRMTSSERNKTKSDLYQSLGITR